MRDLTTDNGWYNVSQAAGYLGVTRRTLYRWISQGRIPAYKRGVDVRGMYVPVQALTDALLYTPVHRLEEDENTATTE